MGRFPVARSKGQLHVLAAREARGELDLRLALEESGNDFWWSQLPPQLRWLRQPDSLQLLLERPVWLAAWKRGEEERAALLWSKLPDDVIHIVLDFFEQLRRRRLAEMVCLQHIRNRCRRRKLAAAHLMIPAESLVASALERAISAEAQGQQCVCQ